MRRPRMEGAQIDAATPLVQVAEAASWVSRLALLTKVRTAAR